MTTVARPAGTHADDDVLPTGVDLPPGYRMAVLGADDEDAILEVDGWGFAFEIAPEVRAVLPFPLEPGRTVGVWAPERAGAEPSLAALHSSYAFTDFGVPGATLPTAGLTWVAVHPQHRRRGLASAMVRTHLERSRARGEALSALFASEPAIYGRFGYGCAAHHLTLTVPRGAPLRDVVGTEGLEVVFETADPARHSSLVADVHTAHVRPGWAHRATEAMRTRAVLDVPAWRDGAERLRIAVVSDAAGEPRGYALFQRKEHWSDLNRPEGTVRIRECVTLDGAASRVLWGALLDLDLMTTVKTGILATDDPLLHLLLDVRAAEPRPTDNLWVRIVDLPAALEGRRYASAVDVVLDVTDHVLPANAGRWRLRAGPDGVAVTASTDDAADLALDVRELGAAYLGGVPLAALARAGLVEERTAGALQAAATAFGWPVAPVCSFVF